MSSDPIRNLLLVIRCFCSLFVRQCLARFQDAFTRLALLRI